MRETAPGYCIPETSIGKTMHGNSCPDTGSLKEILALMKQKAPAHPKETFFSPKSSPSFTDVMSI